MKINEIEDSVKVEPISKNDIQQIILGVIEEFSDTGMSPGEIKEYTMYATNWKISKKLMVNVQLAGFYLLSDHSIFDIVNKDNMKTDPKRFENKSGVEGVALVVFPQYRNKGYGNLLKDLPKTMGYDYVFGMQFKSLGNINQWLKRRELISDSEEDGTVYITAEIFK